MDTRMARPLCLFVFPYFNKAGSSDCTSDPKTKENDLVRSRLGRSPPPNQEQENLDEENVRVLLELIEEQ